MTTANTFELIRTQSVDSLQIFIEEYQHKTTGAQHIHIAADHKENVFLVALRTVPQDSRGVAHILEHTTLCGSERYPVRDPFFMMIRRSMNTFMNAFTSSDWTAYPFASQNKKDFNNLLQVYLDAVYFPTLDRLDFAQEGHRLEFEDMEDPTSPLQFKGVVFNEMKGAMSAPVSLLWHTLSKHLFTDTTYHYNSGGEPRDIPDLTYEDLKNFHKTHYHPSNSIFMTYGDIPAAEHQATFEELALQRFKKSDHQIFVPLETRLLTPKVASEVYAAPEETDNHKQTHVVMGWLLGESTDLKQLIQAQLLTSVLLENSASPLQQTLETTELGKAPSPLCGLDDSQRELIFVCGLEGCEDSAAEKVEALILGCLQSVIDDGVSTDIMQASLHQLELQQKEISGGSYPFGLQLILNALNSATHRGDVLAHFNLEPIIQELHVQILQHDFLPNLCRKLLIENPHRVRLSLQPDSTLAAKQQQQELDKLAAIRQSLNVEQTTNIIKQAKALQARQNQEDDPSVLPKVELTDVPKEASNVTATATQQSPVVVSSYATGTNGLVYQEINLPLPQLSQQQLTLLPILSMVWTELGAGNASYLEMQKKQSAISGGINCNWQLFGTPTDQQHCSGLLQMGGKALNRNQDELSDFLLQTLTQIRFDEPERVRELISQTKARMDNSITGSGHVLAMSAAAQNFSPVNRLDFQTSGLQGIKNIKALDQKLKDPQQLNLLMQKLKALHQLLIQMPARLWIAAEEQQLGSFSQNLSNALLSTQQNTGLSGGQNNGSLLMPTSSLNPVQQCWISNSQVNFCATAFATVPSAHEDAAALSVLGGYLRNNYLHRHIREQGGAYGGGAAQDNMNGVFKFYSYRDPRLGETLQDFQQSVDWMLNSKNDPRLVEEAVLGVVSSLDKPTSPAGEAKSAYQAELLGRTLDIRQQYRDRLLSVTHEHLQRVSQRYLSTGNESTAVLTGKHGQEQATNLGLKLHKLS